MKVAKTDVKNDKGEAVSLVKFTDIYKDTHVYYQVTSDSVKEDIVLVNNTAPQVLEVALTAVNTEYKQDEQKNIYFEKDGKKVFALAPMFMKDANNETSKDITLKLDYLKKGDNGENIYKVTITPSKDWLNAPARKFPVTLDPTVLFSDLNFY